MPATLIKLTINSSIKEFRPETVDLIELIEGSSEILISMVSGSVIRFLTPSPADALIKLGQIEEAMVSGTGIVWITDDNTGHTVSTNQTTTTTTSDELIPGGGHGHGHGSTTTTITSPQTTTTTTSDEPDPDGNGHGSTTSTTTSPQTTSTTTSPQTTTTTTTSDEPDPDDEL